jgi:hypothetical protein
LPELLPFGAMAALDTALQTAPLTRAAAVQRIASRLDRAEILSLDPGLPAWTRMPARSHSSAWARKALSGRSLQSRVDRHFSGLWTDDVPMMTVVVSRPGRPDVVLVSTSQKVMMLPWKRLPSVVFEQQDLDNAGAVAPGTERSGDCPAAGRKTHAGVSRRAGCMTGCAGISRWSRWTVAPGAGNPPCDQLRMS